MPVIALMLAWATIGDRLVIAVAILPLAVVCDAGLVGVVLRGEPLATLWFEVGLIAAGITSAGISLLVVRALGHLGGFLAASRSARTWPSCRGWPGASG